MHILLIAPDAPPKNSPEAIQVGRYLAELAKTCRVTLVTTPIEHGWTRSDSSLGVGEVPHARIEMRLPLHSLLLRAMATRFGERLRVPDKDAWITCRAKQVLAELQDIPDVVYSRSSPFSAALLGNKLARELKLPWVMHLSDPWADSPYRKGEHAAEEHHRLEAACFANAAAVTLTTRSQSDFYARKYPQFAKKLFVSPNVMPTGDFTLSRTRTRSSRLHLVYAGSLYGDRRPTPLLNALQVLRDRCKSAYARIDFSIAGNLTDEVRNEVKAAGLENVSLLGQLDHAATKSLLATADLLVSFEPDGRHHLLPTFFPSKLLDYLAAGRPILAFTPLGSEASKLCTHGHGWAFVPSDVAGTASLLEDLGRQVAAGTWNPSAYTSAPSTEFSASSAARELQHLFISVMQSRLDRYAAVYA